MSMSVRQEKIDDSETLRLIRALPLRFALIPLMVFAIDWGIAHALDALLPNVDDHLRSIIDALLTAVGIAIPLWFLIPAPLARALKREREQVAANRVALEAEMHRQQFEAGLQRALEMASTEADAIRVVRRALVRIAGDSDVSVLLADSSQAHLRVVASSASGDDPAASPTFCCRVPAPSQCVAARHGQIVHCTDSDAIDACPWLSANDDVHRAATCVPISIAGKTIGILHTTSQAQTPSAEGLSAALRTVATQAGARLGVLRTMAASQLAATTDPLTGLLNRRSLEEKVSVLLGGGQPFALVMTDLDHFKKLNDTYSHAVGDRALKVYARVLKNCCRGDDVIARIGGEEFVLVLPELSAEQAAQVMDRIRASLPAAQMQAGMPAFTASFGIVDLRHDGELEGLLRAADHALYAAKTAGRDRVVISATTALPVTTPPQETQPAASPEPAVV